MSEAALKKLTDEKEKLETEVKLLAEAQPVNAACEQ
jgi:cell division protein FtsB